jgi:hypothetical protein
MKIHLPGILAVTLAALGLTACDGDGPVNAPHPGTIATQGQVMPTARPIPGHPGFVNSPHTANPDAIIDVRGMASGTTAADPYAKGKFFKVP